MHSLIGMQYATHAPPPRAAPPPPPAFVGAQHPGADQPGASQPATQLYSEAGEVVRRTVTQRANGLDLDTAFQAHLGAEITHRLNPKIEHLETLEAQLENKIATLRNVLMARKARDDSNEQTRHLALQDSVRIHRLERLIGGVIKALAGILHQWHKALHDWNNGQIVQIQNGFLETCRRSDRLTPADRAPVLRANTIQSLAMATDNLTYKAQQVTDKRIQKLEDSVRQFLHAHRGFLTDWHTGMAEQSQLIVQHYLSPLETELRREGPDGRS